MARLSQCSFVLREESPPVWAVIDPEIIGECSIYTNGAYLHIIIPPPHAATYGYDTEASIIRCFRLSDGLFIRNHPNTLPFPCS